MTNASTEARIDKAIAQDSSAVSPKAVLGLMTELANEDDLAGFSRAYEKLAHITPTQARIVATNVPGMIRVFLMRRRGVGVAALEAWIKIEENSNWAKGLKNAVRHPWGFAHVVEEMATEMKHRPAAGD